MKKEITVIIPCYNVENYIVKCLNSIKNQTFNSLEIIIIDDCSTDNTVEIINNYIKNNSNLNIKLIINDKNNGAGYSRNIALKEANNEYISFIDADDYVENNYYEEMIKKMNEDNSDIVVCDIYVKYENHEMPDVLKQGYTYSEDNLGYINNGFAASPCNKLFKKSDLLKYPFPEGIVNEDIATVISILTKSSKISYTSETYYNYIQHKSSVQNATLSDKKLDLFKAIDILEERIGKYDINNKYWDAIIFNQLLLFIIYVIPKENDKKKRLYFIKRIIKLSSKYDLSNNSLWKDFLKQQGGKHRLYFKMLLFLMTNHFYIFANYLISFYKFYSNKVKKSVLRKDITIDDLVRMAKKQKNLKNENKTVSVVVPNYNYSEFLYQRIYSILYQNYKVNEIIILDDCSIDDSRKKIDNIVEELNPFINISKNYNDKNSGSAFKQWEKGFDLATGDYIWIAEADDYCENNFLRINMNSIKKDSKIKLSYCDTAFIDKKGFKVLRSVKPQIDLQNSKHWNKSFINNGIDEIKDYMYLNCTIANVSSVVFKKDNYKDYFEESGKYRQAGDWLFYINVISNGNISYVNKTLNYYRVHGSNVSSTTKYKNHYEEIVKIHNNNKENYKLDEKQVTKMKERQDFLKKTWNLK